MELGFSRVDPLIGDIVDINAWDRFLPDEQLKEFSECGKRYK